MSILGGVSIPQDILDAIFEATTFKDGELTRPLPHLPPLLLGQICGKWRTSVHRNARLWRKLFLMKAMDENPYHPDTHSALRGLAEQTQYWLERCGPVGLYIALKTYRSDLTSAFLEVVVKPNLTRFQGIDITGIPIAIVQTLTSTAPLPLLKCLAISAPYTPYNTPFHPSPFQGTLESWTGLSRAPAFRRLHFGCRDASWLRFVSSSFPWAQLTHISLTPDLSATLLNELLKACTRLEECTVTYSDPQNSVTPAAPCTVSHLRAFDITFRSTGGMGVLQAFRFPSIRSLALRGTPSTLDENGTWQEVLHSQLHGLSTLTLYLYDIRASCSYTLHLLRSCPKLTTLYLACDLDNYEPLLRALADKDHNSEPFLPNLHTFTLCLKYKDADTLRRTFSPTLFNEMAIFRSGRARSNEMAQCSIVLHIDSVVAAQGSPLRQDDLLEASSRTMGEGHAVEKPPYEIIVVAEFDCCQWDMTRPLWTVTGLDY